MSSQTKEEVLTYINEMRQANCGILVSVVLNRLSEYLNSPIAETLSDQQVKAEFIALRSVFDQAQFSIKRVA